MEARVFLAVHSVMIRSHYDDAMAAMRAISCSL